MNLDDIPLFSMLRGRLGYLNQRQQVLAQNIANADTPDYTPRDLNGFSFKSHLGAQTAAVGTSSIGTIGTIAGSAPHLLKTSSSAGASANFKPPNAPDSETTLDGNRVVLEEQMMKMTDARMSYDAAISFYQKSLGLLRMATRPPGR
jgi:flagellar basal-body rod protein FlgB